MGRNLRHIMVKWRSCYLTWLIYIIGTEQIILLLEIQNGCIICDSAWFIWDKEEETGGGYLGVCQVCFPWLTFNLKVLNFLASICFNYDYLIGNSHPRNVLCPSLWFVNLPSSMNSFTGISLHMRILSGIKGIHSEK